VEVDPLDVTVWHNIGKISMSLKNFQLARHAFLQVLNSDRIIIITNLVNISCYNIGVTVQSQPLALPGWNYQRSLWAR
jgi:hypothetical protein